MARKLTVAQLTAKREETLDELRPRWQRRDTLDPFGPEYRALAHEIREYETVLEAIEELIREGEER